MAARSPRLVVSVPANQRHRTAKTSSPTRRTAAASTSLSIDAELGLRECDLSSGGNADSLRSLLAELGEGDGESGTDNCVAPLLTARGLDALGADDVAVSVGGVSRPGLGTGAMAPPL